MPKTQTPKKPKHLGSRVRIARETAGLTQLALAHAMGYKGEDAGALISRIESGVEEPRLGKLAKLAKALGVSMESLLNPS